MADVYVLRKQAALVAVDASASGRSNFAHAAAHDADQCEHACACLGRPQYEQPNVLCAIDRSPAFVLGQALDEHASLFPPAKSCCKGDALEVVVSYLACRTLDTGGCC
jgi:hypothetical protein